MIRFKLFGYPIRIEWMFWLLCVFLGIRYLDQPGAQNVGLFFLQTVIILLSIIWHELGHAWARRWYGAPYSEITLHGFGGYCAGPGSFTRGQHIVIAAAGPAASLLIGGITIAVAALLKDVEPVTATAIGILIWVNIGWSILNLLPILPMDGGHIAAGILGPRNFHVVCWISLILAALLGGLALIFLGSIFMAILFGMMAYENWQRLGHLRRPR